MPQRAWYHSLYWRIALGFAVFLGGTLLVQAGVFLWLTARAPETFPARSPGRFASLVASDLSGALARDPRLDVDEYVRREYMQRGPRFFVVMIDGRVATNDGGPPPAPLIAIARDRLERGADGPPGDRRPRFFGAAPVIVQGREAGLVTVIPRRYSTVIAEMAPIMTLVLIGVLVIGTALAAVLIFRPAHRRLEALEDATRRLGSGDLAARAPESGGDEIATLARSFNRMAEDLAARAAELQAADQARRQLLADVSHELMTPLTAIRGYLETLSMSELALDARTRARYLEIVSQETSRLERVIGDLLDLARLDGGAGALRWQAVPVESLFGRVAARHERECRERTITLTAAIEPGAEIAIGDPDRLEQALQNLAANALRATPAGGRIDLRAELAPEGVRLSVRDSGQGIPTEHLPFIFDRFYKIDASRAGAAGGSGLGLSIVKAIVERHGGRIAASSAPGAGTLMVITLPSHSPGDRSAAGDAAPSRATDRG